MEAHEVTYRRQRLLLLYNGKWRQNLGMKCCRNVDMLHTGNGNMLVIVAQHHQHVQHLSSSFAIRCKKGQITLSCKTLWVFLRCNIISTISFVQIVVASDAQFMVIWAHSLWICFDATEAHLCLQSANVSNKMLTALHLMVSLIGFSQAYI